MNPELTLALLRDLIEMWRESERGFVLAARDNREPGIVDVLKDGEECGRAAAIELQDQVRLLGAAPDDGRAVTAPVYRGWISFNAVAISRDTKLILEECERGADYARARYQEAMRVELPQSLHAMLERQYQRLIAIHGRVRLMRNRYPATAVPTAIGARPERR
jgi:uncharacterized protein (TIGR02284 family)